jgi:hypothetical protein
LNGNGIPDDKEVAADQDLDGDGVADIDQTDIKVIDSETEDIQVGISIKGSKNAASIVSMEIEDTGETTTTTKSKGKPKSIQFGLIDFKILVENPGDETVVAIHLSRPAFDKGKLFKYDPVNDEWWDYSDYAEFSPNRKVVYLTLKDGGFGDADGIENGIIVDPLTVASETAIDNSGDGDNDVEDFVEDILPGISCFISTAAQPSDSKRNIWSEIRGRELAILFVVILLLFIGKSVLGRRRVVYHGKARNLTDDFKEWILF